MRLLWVVFLTGISSGFGHCTGMCGGFTTACSFAGCAGNPKTARVLSFQALYHTGRLLTYSLLGAGLGFAGSLPSLIYATRPYQRWVPMVAGLLMVIMGLMLALAQARRNPIVAFIEHRPSWITKTAAGLAGRGGRAALPLGLLMGLLPCGMLAALELRALAAGSPVWGAAIMLSFGIGTVPALLGFGLVSGLISAQMRGALMKAGAVIVIIMGIVSIATGFKLLGA